MPGLSPRPARVSGALHWSPASGSGGAASTPTPDPRAEAPCTVPIPRASLAHPCRRMSCQSLGGLGACKSAPRRGGGRGGGHASPALASPGPFPGEPCVEA